MSKEVIAAAVRCSCAARTGSAYVSRLNFTSSEVRSRPLWKAASVERSSVSDSPSSASSHEVANDGWGSSESTG